MFEVKQVWDLILYSPEQECEYDAPNGGVQWQARINENGVNSRFWRDKVIVVEFNGMPDVLMTSDILNRLGESAYMDCQLKWNRRKWFSVTNSEVIRIIEHHINYERRSEREKLVQNRNKQAWQWIQNLLDEASESLYSEWKKAVH